MRNRKEKRRDEKRRQNCGDGSWDHKHMDPFHVIVDGGERRILVVL